MLAPVLLAAAAVQSIGSVLDRVTAPEISAIVEASGGRVQGVEFDERGFSVRFWFPNGLHASFDGYECAADGEATACSEYILWTEFEADDPQAAALEADRLQTVWLNAATNGSVVTVSRMGFTYGGVSMDHLRVTFQVFEQVAGQGLTPLR